MKSLNIHQTRARLSECIALAQAGETIVICKRNSPVAELRGIPEPTSVPRPIGLLKGKFIVPESFFDELPDELIEAFEGCGA